MDSYTWTRQSWPSSKDLHTSSLCRYWMQSRGPMCLCVGPYKDPEIGILASPYIQINQRTVGKVQGQPVTRRGKRETRSTWKQWKRGNRPPEVGKRLTQKVHRDAEDSELEETHVREETRIGQEEASRMLGTETEMLSEKNTDTEEIKGGTEIDIHIDRLRSFFFYLVKGFYEKERLHELLLSPPKLFNLWCFRFVSFFMESFRIFISICRESKYSVESDDRATWSGWSRLYILIPTVVVSIIVFF